MRNKAHNTKSAFFVCPKKRFLTYFEYPKIKNGKIATKKRMRPARKRINAKLHANRKKTAPAMLLKIS